VPICLTPWAGQFNAQPSRQCINRPHLDSDLGLQFPDGADVVEQITEIPLPGLRVVAQPSKEVSAGEAGVNLSPVFVAGPENRIVAATFDRLLSQAQPSTDPAAASRTPVRPRLLALFGPSGVGKTHLSQGLVRHWQRNRGHAGAEYLTAQDFRHQLNAAMSGDCVLDFRERLRTRELVAIDDVHRLPCDDYLLHEFRSALDALDAHGAMVVVTSTKPVTMLTNLSADLRSRLASGLMLQLAAPGVAARTRIVRLASSALGRSLSDDAVQRLATGLRGTANRVIGAIFELFAELQSTTIATVDDANRLLSAQDARRPTTREIVAVVARHFGVPQKLLKSNSRKQHIVRARATAVYLARELSDESYQQIGRLLGGRDHTTIMHNFRKVQRDRQNDFAMQETLDDLRRVLLTH
jgi:chromosomal replication initiator protein